MGPIIGRLGLRGTVRYVTNTIDDVQVERVDVMDLQKRGLDDDMGIIKSLSDIAKIWLRYDVQ